MNYIKSAALLLISFGALIAADQNTKAVPNMPTNAMRRADVHARMGQVISIDKSGGTFVLKNEKGLQDTFNTSDSTKISLKGNKKLSDITPGMGIFAVFQKQNGVYRVLRIEDMPDMSKLANAKKNDGTNKQPAKSTVSKVAPNKPAFSKKDLSFQKGVFVSLNEGSKFIIINEKNILDTIVYNDSTRMKTPSKKPAITDLKVGAELMICSRIINSRKTALEIWERFINTKAAQAKPGNSK